MWLQMNKIKIFVDDYRDPHSAEYFVCTSTNDAIATIEILMNKWIEIEVLDLDYDAGWRRLYQYSPLDGWEWYQQYSNPSS